MNRISKLIILAAPLAFTLPIGAQNQTDATIDRSWDFVNLSESTTSQLSDATLWTVTDEGYNFTAGLGSYTDGTITTGALTFDGTTVVPEFNGLEFYAPDPSGTTYYTRIYPSGQGFRLGYNSSDASLTHRIYIPGLCTGDTITFTLASTTSRDKMNITCTDGDVSLSDYRYNGYMAFQMQDDETEDRTFYFSAGRTNKLKAITVTKPRLTFTGNETTSPITDSYPGGCYVTLQRPIVSTGWNALCLPFDITVDSLKSLFGSDAKVCVYSSSSSDGTNVTLNFTTTTGTLTAGTPFLLQSTKSFESSVTFPGAQLSSEATAQTAGSDDAAKFAGQFTQSTLAQGSTVYYFSTNDGKFYQYTPTDGETQLPGYRAYIFINTASGAKSISISVDGETTGIERLAFDPTETASQDALYNVAGQRVGKDAKGIVIKNGKKYIQH